MPKRSETKELKKIKEDEYKEFRAEFNEKMKQQLTDEVVSDIKSSFDSEYKNEVKTQIKNELISDIKKDVQKEQKKLSRSKSFKIFRLYIYLIIVLVLACYMIYRLYINDSLYLINKNLTKPTTSKYVDEQTETTTEKVKDLTYYTDNYGSLINDLKISNLDLVKGNVSVEQIGNVDRLAMAYASLNAEDIQVDGMIHVVSEEAIINAYKKIFGDTSSYTQENLVVSNLNYTYSSTSASYMAIGEESSDTSYVNNVLENAYEEENDIIFVARTYIIKNGNVYSTTNGYYRLMVADENMDITKVLNRLPEVEYRFTKIDNQYVLKSIIKK